MNPTYYIILVFLIGGFYIASPRLFNNILLYLFKKNSFVVVIIRATATRKASKWFVVPDAKNHFITHIGKGSYDLTPENEAYKRNNRSYFICNQEDAMPLKFKEVEVEDENILYKYGGKIFFKSNDEGIPVKLDPRTDDDYIIGSDRVKESLTSKSHRALHGSETNLWMILALVAVLIAVIVAIYAINYIQHAQPILDAIYQKIQSTDQIVINPLPTPTK